MEHSQLVANLIKPGQEILDSLTPEKIHLIHMAIGVCGEAGELADAIKKYAVYVKPLDLDNVIEELGDLEFYMEGIRQALNISRELTLQNNVDKLSVRYSSGKYSNKQAQDRADKEGV